jgi:hypothetical protein
LVELEYGSRRQHEVEYRRAEIAVGDLTLLQQPGDQLLHVGLVELHWLCFLEHEQRPRIAGHIDAAIKVLPDDIVQLPVLHRERDRGIDRVDVGREPRCLTAEKDVLKLSH